MTLKEKIENLKSQGEYPHAIYESLISSRKIALNLKKIKLKAIETIESDIRNYAEVKHLLNNVGLKDLQQELISLKSDLYLIEADLQLAEELISEWEISNN